MNVCLLFPDRDPQWRETPDPGWEDRFRDLHLEPLVSAMAGEDPLLQKVCRQTLDSSLPCR